MIQLGIGEKNALTLRNGSFRGFRIGLNCPIKSAWDSPTELQIDWDKVNIKITTLSFGKKVNTYSGSIKPLLFAHSFKNAQFDLVRGGFIPYDANTRKVGFEIAFGTVMNLKGSDQMVIEVDFNSGFSVADDITETSASLSVSGVRGIGKQTFIPAWEYAAIPPASNNFDRGLGDNVIGIHFIHVGTLGSTSSTTRILTNAKVDSDRVVIDADYDELVNERTDQFTELSKSLERGGCFEIIGEENDSVNLSLTLDSTKVQTGENYVFVHRFVQTEKMLTTARRRAEKHARHAFKKLT